MAAVGLSVCVTARAAEMFWECIVGVIPTLRLELRAPPLEEGPYGDALASSPLLPLLQQAESVFSAGALPTTAFLRMPAVAYRLVP